MERVLLQARLGCTNLGQKTYSKQVLEMTHREIAYGATDRRKNQQRQYHRCWLLRCRSFQREEKLNP